MQSNYFDFFLRSLLLFSLLFGLLVGWIRLLELTVLPLERLLRVLRSLADLTLLISAVKLTTRMNLSSFFG